MSFDQLSRRHFAGIAGCAALGLSTEFAEAADAAMSKESRRVDRSQIPGFPNDFLWGTATSAYQVEGAVKDDGRGPSIWDRYAHEPGTIADHSNADVANDSYHRYKEDVQLIKALGAKAYRFSIAWPRVFPEGVGAPNPKGLDFYNRLVDELLANSIEPFATLYHWDLPQALQDRLGGWRSPDTSKAFANYAAYVVERLSDRVRHIFTINECSRLVHLGHGLGLDAPGLKLPQAELNQVRHNVALATWSCGTGNPGAWTGGYESRPSGEPGSLRVVQLDPSALCGRHFSLTGITRRTTSIRTGPCPQSKRNRISKRQKLRRANSMPAT